MPYYTPAAYSMSHINISQRMEKKNPLICQMIVWTHPLCYETPFLFYTHDNKISKGNKLMFIVINKADRRNRATSCWHFNAWSPQSQSNSSQRKQWLILFPPRRKCQTLQCCINRRLWLCSKIEDRNPLPGVTLEARSPTSPPVSLSLLLFLFFFLCVWSIFELISFDLLAFHLLRFTYAFSF